MAAERSLVEELDDPTTMKRYEGYIGCISCVKDRLWRVRGRGPVERVGSDMVKVRVVLLT